MKKAEFLDKYGDVVVHFSNYYKYTFCFEGENELVVFAGGDKDNIYRCSIKPQMAIRELDEETGGITLASQGNEEIGSWEIW